ncbi:MAG: hypothetical protein JW999_10410 [Methanotrichaceae archaeon]|nr:hypothetical protein [Methanotrichaceae archaeon]
MCAIRLLPLLFLLSTCTATVQWQDYARGDLHWNDSLILENYTVTVKAFSSENSSSPKVLLNLANESHERSLILGENDSFCLDDDLVNVTVGRVVVSDPLGEVYLGPHAEVSLWLPAGPDLIHHIFSDKDVYNPGEEIVLRLDMENVGTEDAEDIDVEVSSQDPSLMSGFKNGVFKYSTSQIGAGETHIMGKTDDRKPKKITLRAPCLPYPKRYNIIARVNFSDTRGTVRNYSSDCTFDVAGQLHLHKYMNDLMEINKSYQIILSIRNLGEKTLMVNLTDEVCAEFFEVNRSRCFDCTGCNCSKLGSNLNWSSIAVTPGNTIFKNYTLVPKNATKARESLILPGATAEYSIGGKAYKVTSESNSVDVIDPQWGQVRKANNLSNSSSNSSSAQKKLSNEESQPENRSAFDAGHTKGLKNADSLPQNAHLHLWALSAILLIYWFLGRIS